MEKSEVKVWKGASNLCKFDFYLSKPKTIKIKL